MIFRFTIRENNYWNVFLRVNFTSVGFLNKIYSNTIIYILNRYFSFCNTAFIQYRKDQFNILSGSLLLSGKFLWHESVCPCGFEISIPDQYFINKFYNILLPYRPIFILVYKECINWQFKIEKDRPVALTTRPCLFIGFSSIYFIPVFS